MDLKKKNQQQSGFSLMEVLVSLFVIMILTVGVYSLIILYLQISNDNKMYVIAIELANQKMEQIRNMPYDDVGVVGGIPYGLIPPSEAVEREGRFTINSYVTFYDDPADGQAGSTTPDTIPTDYKIATVKVNWQAKSGVKDVTIFSKIIPRTVETNQGYGLLKITVRDSYAQPVPNASVRVVNNAVSPAIDVINPTNAQGLLYLPATSSVEAYEITVAKTDQEPAVYWGQDQTYAAATGKTPRHLTVSEGNMTEEEFQIDPLATLRLRTVSTNLPDNFQVNETKGWRDESRPRVSADGSGNLYFTWQGEQSTSSLVYLAKYDSGGNRLWADDKTIGTSLSQSRAEIAADSAGNLYAVWQDASVALKAVTVSPGATRYARAALGNNLKNALSLINKEVQARWQPLTMLGRDFAGRARAFWAGFGRLASALYEGLDAWSRQTVKRVFLALKTEEVKAAATIVQVIKVSGVVTASTSVSLSYNSPPTAGNLLVVVAIHENSNQAFTTVVNAAGAFSESAVSNAAFGLDVGIWHKLAGVSEPSSVTVSASGNFEGGVMMLMEIAGIDPADPVNVVKPNNQTSASSRTATTGLSPVSTASGFAVAAIAFADNDFDNPTSANWTSGSSDTWTQRQWTEINGDDDSSIGVATMDVTAAAAQSATLTVTGGWNGEERNSVLVVYNLYDPDDVRVEAGGTQYATLLLGSTGSYVGGYFVLSDLTGSRNVTGLKISENGTIDAQNDLDNIKLFYDWDTVAPYDCADEIFDGTEAQFGATATGGFSAADGYVQMNGSAAISTTQTMCVYAVLDVGAGADKGETIELQIADPANDVAVDAGTALPGSAPALPGTTSVTVPAVVRQTAYRWRSDSGDEDGAYWLAAAGSAVSVTNGEKVRLRFLVENAGSLSNSPAYRLEYGEKVTTCSALGALAWTALPASDADDWRSTSSVQYADGEPTTQQIGTGVFAAGEIKQDANQTASLALAGDTATELEFALAPTANAGDASYCFRLTDAGAVLDGYDVYAEAIVVGDNNVYIIKLDSAGNQVWAAKRANNDDSSADQTEPRIVLTENLGAATTIVAWLDDRAGQSDVYAQAFDAAGNALWNGGNEIVITASATDETAVAVVIDSNDGVIFAWTEAGTVDKVYLMKYDLAGNSLWPSPVLGPLTLFGISQPALAADLAGNFYLGYVENASGNLGAYLAKYDGAGSLVWDRATHIDAAAGARYEPSLAVRGLDLYAAWTDERDGDQDVYGQKFDLSGNPAWSRDLLISIVTAMSSSTQPALAITAAGEPFAAWTDGRNPEVAIYAAEMFAPGAITPVPNVKMRITGSNTISETPRLYEYDLYVVTNGSGQADIRVETDTGGYTAEATSTYSLILFDPPTPLNLLPGQDQTWNIYVQ